MLLPLNDGAGIKRVALDFLFFFLSIMEPLVMTDSVAAVTNRMDLILTSLAQISSPLSPDSYWIYVSQMGEARSGVLCGIMWADTRI